MQQKLIFHNVACVYSVFVNDNSRNCSGPFFCHDSMLICIEMSRFGMHCILLFLSAKCVCSVQFLY